MRADAGNETGAWKLAKRAAHCANGIKSQKSATYCAAPSAACPLRCALRGVPAALCWAQLDQALPCLTARRVVPVSQRWARLCPTARRVVPVSQRSAARCVAVCRWLAARRSVRAARCVLGGEGAYPETQRVPSGAHRRYPIEQVGAPKKNFSKNRTALRLLRCDFCAATTEATALRLVTSD